MNGRAPWPTPRSQRSRREQCNREHDRYDLEARRRAENSLQPDRQGPIPPPRRSFARAFGFLALVALAALVRLALPVSVGLVLGALLAFTLEPAYRRLRSGWMRRGPAALVCAVGATTMALLTILREQLASGGALRIKVQRSTMANSSGCLRRTSRQIPRRCPPRALGELGCFCRVGAARPVIGKRDGVLRIAISPKANLSPLRGRSARRTPLEVNAHRKAWRGACSRPRPC